MENVSKSFSTRSGPVAAVANVSFEVKQGEFLSIIGPSGCGKSTLLRMMCGLVSCSEGRVLIGDEAVDRPYTNLGIVFQDDLLLDWRSVFSNVMLQCEIRGLNGSQYRDRAQELLRSSGLAGFEDRYPYELSGGMRQRASICRALVHDPPLLLMDEPFGALDALTRDQMNVDLSKLWRETRKTVVFITHSITEAIFLGDRVLVMSPRPGRIDRVIPIDLPHPRRLSVRESPEFGEHYRLVRQIFFEEGVLVEPGDGE